MSRPSVHEQVFGKTGEKEVDAEIDASIEEVVDSERSEVKTKDPESLEHWPNDEPKVAQEEQDATELAAVRERLGIAPQDKEQKKVNLEYNLHKDEDYVQIRDSIYARNREKHSNLIEVEAEREFQRRFPQKFAEHEAAEAERIYTDTQGRPFLRNDPTYQRMFIRREHGGGGRNDNLHYEVNAAQFDFIDRYPVKAAAYATTDEGIAYKLKLRKEQYERDRERRAAA